MVTDASNTGSEVIVRAVGLTKEFRDFWNRPKAKAVNDIDFDVKEGEIFGLLGPNGSGKSTTVKMLLGLLYPTGGTLSVFGKSPQDVKTKQMLGYLPEETYLYKYLTAYETLDFFGALFNLSAAERKNRAEQLLDMVGLSHAKNRPVGEFSKGMARRIGLAQAMINDPALLILDEPTSGLDPVGCREVKDLILHLKKRGKTVIVTSHLLSDVEDVCDRVVILYGGKIRAEGTLDKLLTVAETSRITMPSLSAEHTEKVLKLLRENLSGEEFKIDHPRKTLEDFFLDVICKARSESLETSGVVSGGHIADYLGTDENAKSDKVLESLIKKDEAVLKPAAVAEAAPIIPDAAKLEKLTAEEPVKKADDAASVETPAEVQAKLDEANEKLKKFLSK